MKGSVLMLRRLIEDAIEWGKSPPDYGCDMLNEALLELDKIEKDFLAMK